VVETRDDRTWIAGERQEDIHNSQVDQKDFCWTETAPSEVKDPEDTSVSDCGYDSWKIINENSITFITCGFPI